MGIESGWRLFAIEHGRFFRFLRAHMPTPSKIWTKNEALRCTKPAGQLAAASGLASPPRAEKPPADADARRPPIHMNSATTRRAAFGMAR